MPRSVPGGGRNSCVYWWTPEIAELRASCMRARRRFLSARRRRRMRDGEEISRGYGVYREARQTLQREIKIAKARSWKELIEAVESNPWGRSYKVVTRKLRHAAPPLTANMDQVLLAKVIGTLFPLQDSVAGRSGSSLSSGGGETSSERSEELRVTQEELLVATKKMASRDVAPGPDGVPSRVWAETMEVVAPRMRHLFTRCLREGIYPRMWRTARLVLLRKEGRTPDSLSAYRPICLLDEIGKLFERGIATRLEAHISQRVPVWHDSQYGFRRGRSVDAVKRVRSMAEDMVSRYGMVVAVSVDVSNAFNSFPWASIMEALRHFEVPAYLVEVIGAYLNDRWITFTGRNGEERRCVERGVPQGSVLGPILWITA
jgi:hypothetical protein